MSRYFMLQSWVGSHENEPDCNGQQCGERNVRSIEAVPLYDQYGNANTKAFSDEALKARNKPSIKPKVKRSAYQSITLADQRYARLEAQLEALEGEYADGLISVEDLRYASHIIQTKMQRAWKQITKERQAVGQWLDDEEDDCLEAQYSSSIKKQGLIKKVFSFFFRGVLTDKNKRSKMMTTADEILLNLSEDNTFRKAWTFIREL